MTTRATRALFGVWIVALTCLYYAFPESKLYTWALLGYSSAAMVLIGVHLNRPARRLPWYLISAALASFASGDAAYNLIIALGREPGFPGVVDLLYLLVYPLLTGAFVVFVNSRSGGVTNRAALLDALVPTVALGLVSWIYWIAPFTRARDLTWPEKIVSIGYPLGDVLALALMLRILTTPGRRSRALSTIAAAMVGLLVSDIFYGQSQLNSEWTLGGPVDFGWIVFYAAMAFSTLLPSMRELTEPTHQHEADGAGPRRIIYMTSAALIAPAVLLIEWFTLTDGAGDRGYVVDAPVIAAAAAVMFVLVLARVNDLVLAQRAARSRERALRQASASLFAASTATEVLDAARTAIGSLLPAGQENRVILTEETEGWPETDGIRQITPAELPPGMPAAGFTTFLYGTLRLPGRDGQLAGALIAAPEPVLRDLSGSFEALYGQVRVVLQRIGLSGEVSRRNSEAYFRTLIQNAADVILIIDEDDRIRYASPSAEAVFGYPDLVGTPLAALITTGDGDALGRVLAGIRRSVEHSEVGDLSALCANGDLLQVECTGRDLRDDETVAGLVLTVRDVTERRRLEKELSHLAFHDGLTGLANRVLFRNRLEAAYATAGRDGATVGVLFVDLDDFKEVNDTLGHAVGDQLLVAVGRRIAGVIGDGNTAARMGGDEFAILIEPSPDATATEQTAARIVAALATPVELADTIGGSHIVSGAASVGLAISTDANTATELLRHADLALYQAKGDAKGTWQRYQPELHTAMVRRLETRAALHEAIDNAQFVPMYQPIVDLHTGLITGVESLVRWQHPARGLLSPYHFIEVAEESGAIVAIGESVLRQGLAQFAAWRAADPDTSLRYVSVNVSARQFRTAGFVDLVRDALAESGAEPGWLLLEITESLVLRDADQVWDDLRTLRAMGVRIAIDDFGTGYSSLSYLRQMPVDVLKLDKSFIDDILTSEQQFTMVDAIVTLARNLDLAVVAEGIEDAGQRAALARMGCPYGQGYLFAKPVWPAEIVELTRSDTALV